jgi:hypothetical protein
MSHEFSESNDEISKFQAQINWYRKNFYSRSRGFELPQIDYIGSFQKPRQDNNISEPEFFVSIPIKNQDQIIVSIIITLIENTNYPFALGLLFDNCDDESEKVCRDFFTFNFDSFKNLSQVHFIRSYGELFESTCENILLLLCKSPFFVSMQADIFLTDKTFFDRSLKGFDLVPNLFALSGRAVIRLRDKSRMYRSISRLFSILRRSVEFLSLKKNLRKLGPYVYGLNYFGDISDPPKSTMNFTVKEFQTIFLGEAVIRGPIIWRSKILKQLSGFNDLAHVLGRDECDLCLRAINRGFVVGYIPSRSYSYKKMGTSRKTRTPEVQLQLFKREKLGTENPSDLSLLWSGSLQMCKSNSVLKKKILLS